MVNLKDLRDSLIGGNTMTERWLLRHPEELREALQTAKRAANDALFVARLEELVKQSEANPPLPKDSDKKGHF